MKSFDLSQKNHCFEIFDLILDKVSKEMFKNEAIIVSGMF